MLPIEWSDLCENVKSLGSFVGALTAVGAFVLTVSKPIRRWLVQKIRGTANSDALEKTISDMNNTLSTILSLQQEQQEALRKQMKADELQREAILCQIRNTITHIYQMNMSAKTLTILDKENVIKLYEVYVALGGNSYVKQIYNEMMEFDVVE